MSQHPPSSSLLSSSVSSSLHPSCMGAPSSSASVSLSWMVFVLAGGNSSRMGMSVSKVWLPLGGRCMVDYVLDVALSVGSVYAVIHPHGRPLATRSGVHWIEQSQALGTAHAFSLALACAMEADPDWSSKRIVVLMGDAPLVTLEDIAALMVSSEEKVVVLGMKVHQPQGYGRLVMSGNRVQRIVECKEAQGEHQDIRVCYSGVMALSASLAADFMRSMSASSVTGEFYLTSIVEHAGGAGIVLGSPERLQGVNTRVQFMHAEECLQQRFRQRAVEQGAILMSPSTTFLSYDTVMAPGVMVYPMVWMGTGVVLDEGVVVWSHSVLQGCHVHCGGRVGPFARLREGTEIHEGGEVGNFVEIKKSVVGKKSKVKHLSYVGDTTMGERVNIGAGVIICNYDGHTKHQTTMGHDVFVGSLSCLIAPVSLGDHSTVGAGSVITRSVADKTLAVTRSPQKDIPLPPSSKHLHRGRSSQKESR